MSNYTRVENFSHLVSEEKCLILDSGGKGSTVSPDGSRFEVILENNLEIPKNALNITTDVHRVFIWNTFHNVTTKNNAFSINATKLDNSSVAMTIFLDSGVYTPATLNTNLRLKLQEAGFSNDLMKLEANTVTGKIQITFTQQCDIALDVSNTIADLIGFNKGIFSCVIGTVLIGSNHARFNTHQYLLLKSNLCSGEGILLNDTYNNYICQIPISVPPYSQIQDILSQPVELQSNLLRGNFGSKRIWIELCNDQGEPIDTNGESFSVLLKIKYSYKKYEV